MSIVKRFIPLMDRVLVQKIKTEAKTASGIFLPDTAKKDPNWAKVLATGPGRLSKESEWGITTNLIHMTWKDWRHH
eukprot:g6602.t1